MICAGCGQQLSIPNLELYKICKTFTISVPLRSAHDGQFCTRRIAEF